MLKILPTIGWREWIHIKGIRSKPIKAKIDTGAKTSALHAQNIEIEKIGKRTIVHFDVFASHTSDRHKRVSADMVEERWVKDTGGRRSLRPVILTQIKLGRFVWDIEVTLTSRNDMKHEFLLGRDAIKGRFLVNVARSFLLGKLEK